MFMSSAELMLENVKISAVERNLKDTLHKIGLNVVEEKHTPTGFSLTAIEGKRIPLWAVNIVTLFGPVLLRNRIGVEISANETEEKKVLVCISIKHYMAELDLEAPKSDKVNTLKENRLLNFLKSTISDISGEKVQDNP